MNLCSRFSFFFNVPPTTEIYALSLHDALPILLACRSQASQESQSFRRCERPYSCGLRLRTTGPTADDSRPALRQDRKSTRLNSSHTVISYAVFCLKKKKT